MNDPINLEPDETERQQVLDKYRARENGLPKSPGKTKQILFAIPFFMVTLPPVLLLLLARVPFILIRKLRIAYLHRQHNRYYTEAYRWDPDMEGRDIPAFQAPKKGPTDLEKRLQKDRAERETRMQELKTAYLADPSLGDKALDYATLHGYLQGPEAKHTSLYILDRLYENNEIHLSRGTLYRNLGVLLHRLDMPNNHHFFSQPARENGGFKEGEKPNYMSIVSDNSLIREAWSYLLRDVRYCWPR